MSWQDYVDNQLLASQCVNKACIAGHDGNIWAQSSGFEVTKEELAKLISGFDQQDLLTSNGVTLAGQRYIYLSGTDRVVRAKLGRSGVHCMKTTQAVIVSIYEDPVQPQQAASVVEKLGDYLITCGY
ncbi:profilin [Drosophila hydei]|uniref:Profilin n=1 Tax=Drosophila hydei TaxID=7224 RepID=A0A6J1M7F7_DROHY|nr:profilin [Drosophila hydei]XP_023175126.1 profilin [Drosophila hydei]